MKKPLAPPVPEERRETVRQTIAACIAAGPRTAREISQAVGVREKDVYGHLEHIRRTAGLAVMPAVCGECGFVFAKRDRLSPPSRCPLCRSGRIDAPLFALPAEPEGRE